MFLTDSLFAVLFYFIASNSRTA